MALYYAMSLLILCILGFTLAGRRYRGLDQDPQRVFILRGPVAAKHSKVKDTPIKDLLGNINTTLIDNVSIAATSARSRPLIT
jgi:hypothetical protein